MREIKFRVWNGFRWEKSWNLNLIEGFNSADRPQIKVEQFTGLKDKNGKEIYEGDIVKAVGESIIQWNKDTFTVEYRAPIFYPLNLYPEVEVIGNIHEQKS